MKVVLLLWIWRTKWLHMPPYMAQSAGNAFDAVKTNQMWVWLCRSTLKDILCVIVAFERCQRTVVPFLTAGNIGASEIYHLVQNVHDTECESCRLVFEWCRNSCSGRSIEYKSRPYLAPLSCTTKILTQSEYRSAWHTLRVMHILHSTTNFISTHNFRW